MPRASDADRSCPCRNAGFGYLLLIRASAKKNVFEERVTLRSRGREMTLSFPPFTKAVIWLLGINTAVFLFLRAFGSASLLVWVYDNLGLVPRTAVFHGEVWQVVTYSFVHYDFWHWFGNMLGIWMF